MPLATRRMISQGAEISAQKPKQKSKSKIEKLANLQGNQ
jgi:hypothetical protein